MNKKVNRKVKDNLKALLSNTGALVTLVAICTIVIAIIMNWETVVHELGKLIKILMPFILGIVMAFLINPMTVSIGRFLDRFFFKERAKKICKYVSVALSYVIFLGALVVTIVYIVPQISESLQELMKSLGKGYDYIINHGDEIQKKYPALPMDKVADLVKNVVPANLFGYGKDVAKIVFPYIYSLSTSFISGVINAIFSIVISCYLILDKEKIVKNMRRIVYVFSKEDQAPVIWETVKECNHIFNGFLFGKAIDSLIIGILSFIVMTIIGLPYALLLSVIVGITNMIPYFGPFIGAVPGVIIYLVIEPKYAIIYVVMIFILQQFDGLYLGPKILGDLTGIKPLWVIFGITVGGAYYGVLGMFLGVPSVAVIMHIINKVMEAKIKKKMRKKHQHKEII